ncbi:Gfo/Idh/MocA family protein [Legionella clemsonensis]|uniref:4-carboxy-2-hydroxymuconate-6-semialdehyde dehydrogenase n=1 Tax=Legionella clemsonensis TaxID=1867846 RepID=A0A222P3J1_9GAMM|nr:Gfo/Idh/MocA family oxidoreductase [Legionella clemsonensis]ASQ46430.1 4-carboxy-2-hydroxymuconate-6-semialdehyde dehydrogenase [Legionella clemsonensis]
MNGLNVAVIGAGKMGREHIKAFQAIDGVKVTGLFSRTKTTAEQMAKEFNIPCVTDSVADLYEKSAAHLVVVAVPELQANSIAKACFQHNWNVLLEKPAGYDLRDANDIAEAALQARGQVFVALNRRFYSSALTILSDLNANNDAKRYIHIQDQQSFAEARGCHHPEEVVQKFMYANSIHVIDLIRYFARGEVTHVQQISPWQQEKSQMVISYIEFDSGDKALYECIWQGPGPWACAVSTAYRRWSMQPLEKACFQNANERIAHEVEMDIKDQQFKAGFYRQAQEVCKAVLGEKSQVITIKESLKTMGLINKIYGV